MNRESIETCLAGKTAWAGSEIHYYDITDSTNVRAWQETGQSTGNGALFVADAQLGGKGRRGRSWESPGGRNLYFSLVLKEGLSADRAPMVTLVMALSVAKVLKDRTGCAAGIKWPNDIVAGGRKVCGILTEMKLGNTGTEFVVIGVGINVLTGDFEGDLADRATSLEAVCGKAIDRAGLLADILAAFEAFYGDFTGAGDLSPLKEAYEEFLINKDREVRVLDPKGEYTGTAQGITDSGELLVIKADGTIETVYAGEVSVRGIYGYV